MQKTSKHHNHNNNNNNKTLKQNYNTVPDTSSGAKQTQSNEKELQTSANENTNLPNDTLPSNQEETLSQEQKVNLENVKRIMSSEKTILPSWRNIEWKTLKIETEKINHILPYIPTNNITNLCRSKIILWENWDPLKKHEETVKIGMGNSTGNANKKKTRKQARIIRKRGPEISGGWRRNRQHGGK